MWPAPRGRGICWFPFAVNLALLPLRRSDREDDKKRKRETPGVGTLFPLGGCRVEGVGLGDVVVVDARMSVHAHIQHVGMWISG